MMSKQEADQKVSADFEKKEKWWHKNRLAMEKEALKAQMIKLLETKAKAEPQTKTR